MKQMVIFLMLGLFCYGCSAGKKNPGPSTQPGATVHAVSDSIPIAWTQITLNKFQPLIKVQQAGDSTDFSYKLSTGPDGDRVLYFGEIKNGDDQLMPIVAQRTGRHFIVAKMRRQWGYDQWQQVLSGPKEDEIWAVFDQAEENQTHEITLVHSLDGGQTFRLGVMPKPCKAATFYDFVMAKNGIGRLTLGLAKNCSDRIKAGLYHYRTTDDGMSWSPPEYEPDATQPSDDVPDDEQPSEEGQMSASAH